MNVVRRSACAVVLAACIALAASQPWKGKDPKQWTRQEAETILTASPWAQGAEATFPDPREAPPTSVYSLPGPAQAGMASPAGATDGKWDGGVSRNNGAGLLPTLSVLVRWDSALPVRQALLRSKEVGMKLPPEQLAAAAKEPKSYALSVTGLLPGKEYQKASPMPTKSTSDPDDGTRPALSTEQVLEGLMENTRLAIRKGQVLHPENVTMDADTGAIHIFFPRTTEITKADKEVLFTTRFGSLNVEKRFRLSELMYQGHLEL